MKFILTVIVKSNLFVLLIYLGSYLLEKFTNFKFLFWSLRRKQNKFMALGAANTAAIIYFITNMIVLLYNLDKFKYRPEGYTFIGWLIITIILTVVFRKIHLKLSRIEPERDNFDFSD